MTCSADRSLTRTVDDVLGRRSPDCRGDLDPPSDAVRDWIAGTVGTPTARWSRQLLGGTHARTDVVCAPVGQQFVLRRFSTGDDAVHRESRVLDALDGLDGLAPRLLACDPDGAQLCVPTILTTLLPGCACINPEDPQSFARTARPDTGPPPRPRPMAACTRRSGIRRAPSARARARIYSAGDA